MKEELITCGKCEGNACLHSVNDKNFEVWFCFGCGFTTSSDLVQGSNAVNDFLNTMPELYKDLMFEDGNKVWIPCTINLPTKGIIFADGTDIHNWIWSVALAVPIPEEEKFRFSEDQTHKIDFETKKEFKQKDFMEALDYLGFFKVEDVI